MASQTNAPKPIHSVAKEEAVSALAVVSGGGKEFLAVGDRDGNLEIYSLEIYRIVFSAKLDCSLLTIQQLPDSDYFITQTRSSKIQSWSITADGLMNKQTLCYEYMRFCGLQVTKHKIIVPWNETGVVKLLNWDLEVTREMNICGNSGDLMFLQVVDGDLCAAGFERKVILVDTATGEVFSRCDLEHSLMCISYSSKFSRIFCGTAESLIVLSVKPNETSCDKILPLPETGAASVCIRPDEKIVACGCWDGRIRVYSCKSLKPLAVMSFHEKSVTSLVFTPPSSNIWKKVLLIAAGEDGLISVWDIYN